MMILIGWLAFLLAALMNIVKPKSQVQVPMQVPMSPKPKKSPIQVQGTWGDSIILWATTTTTTTHPPITFLYEGDH